MDDLDDRLRRASVNSLESDSAARAPTPPADLDAPLVPQQAMSGGLPADAEGAAQLMEEAARSSYKSRLRRRQQTREQQTTTCGQRQRRCRHRVEHWLDHSVTQTILVLLVLAETAAATGELMIERGVLSFASCQNTCDLGLCGQYRLRPTDFQIYTTLHAISVTILCLFEVEFLLMFYSLGFRCCCKSGAPLVLLDGIPTPPSPLFLGRFGPVFRRFSAVPLRCPASWRRDGENGRKMAENGRNLGEKRARNSGG